MDQQPADLTSMTAEALLARINAATDDGFLELAGPFVENAPWLVARIAAKRPFSGPADVLEALCAAVQQLSAPERLRLLNAHPELAGLEARDGSMTAASVSEQGRLGLDRLDASTARNLTEGNALYRMRFGFPFIIALHRQPDLIAVMAQLERRLQAQPDVETAIALDEVVAVITGRLARTFGPFTPVQATVNGD